MLSGFDFQPLSGIRALTLAINIPGPVAAARLRELGATVVKVEPPGGDPLAGISPAWYESLTRDQKIVRLDLKEPDERAQLDDLLEASDLLITATRSSALDRLSLGWSQIHAKFPRLSHVAIIGHPPPNEDVAGHDATYQAELGLIAPPHLPRTLLADLAGAERVVSAAVTLLFERERNGVGGHARVSLVEAARIFADPLRYGITTLGGPLGGALPGYNIYRTLDGWVVVAALESHFWERLQHELRLCEPTQEELGRVFLARRSLDWQEWASARDLPLVAVPEALSESSRDVLEEVAWGTIEP
jgi:crotonobetainyl-CoA:carnitine CoA-transferase CaiB-like acyl-CoA transferase